MDCDKCSGRYKKILHCIAGMPQKMLSMHGADNTTEFVLHELCGSHCFNLPKAAYFVDNADFNCCKGVAGCCSTEWYQHPDDAWKKPDHFSEHMQQAMFNKKVRQIHTPSFTHELDSALKTIADQLDIKNPGYHMWDLKNDNKGILVFERDSANYDQIKDLLPHGLSLLGFCPIF